MTASTRNFPDPVAAAIFDFDETMIDLEPQHTSASVELCRSFGDDYATLPESWRHGSGRRVIDDVQDLRVHFGWQKPVDEIFALRQSFFDRACAEAPLELMAGVEESVRALHAAGIVLAITSSAVRGSIGRGSGFVRGTELRSPDQLVDAFFAEWTLSSETRRMSRRPSSSATS